MRLLLILLRIALTGLLVLVTMVCHGAFYVHVGPFDEHENVAVIFFFICSLLVPGLYAIWTTSRVSVLRKLAAVIAAVLTGVFLGQMKGEVAFFGAYFALPGEEVVRGILGMVGFVLPTIVARLIIAKRSPAAPAGGGETAGEAQRAV